MQILYTSEFRAVHAIHMNCSCYNYRLGNRTGELCSNWTSTLTCTHWQQLVLHHRRQTLGPVCQESGTLPSHLACTCKYIITIQAGQGGHPISG